MDDKLKEYFSNAENTRSEMQGNYLIELGLYDKEYSPDGSCSDEYKLFKFDKEENKNKYYKKVPIE